MEKNILSKIIKENMTLPEPLTSSVNIITSNTEPQDHTPLKQMEW